MAWPASPTAGLFYAIGDRYWIADGTAWRKYYGGFYELTTIEVAVQEWDTDDDETDVMGGFYELTYV